MKGEQADFRVARALFKLFLGLIAFSILGSALSVFAKVEPGVVAPVTAALLLTVGAALVGLELGKSWSILFLMAFTTAAEVCGVATGFPFGRYSYSVMWWPSVELGSLTFPLMAPFAWLLVAGGASAFVGTWLNGWPRWVVAALMAAVIDAPMEVSMTHVFKYWAWEGDRVPWTNFAGWFGVSLVATLPFWTAPPKGERSGMVLGAFCAFLAVTGAFRFLSPAWVALGLVGIAMFLLSLKKVKATDVS